MRKYGLGALLLLALSCSEHKASTPATTSVSSADYAAVSTTKRHFEGTITRGMKGAISFDLSADGQRMENVALSGYWYCDGKLESIMAGPDTGFPVINNQVTDSIVENEGTAAFRFYMNAAFDGKAANGIFKMTLHPGYCSTGDLEWKATAQ